MNVKMVTSVSLLGLLACASHPTAPPAEWKGSASIQASDPTVVVIGGQRFLREGLVVPPGRPVEAPPEPFDRRRHRLRPSVISNVNLVGRPGESIPTRFRGRVAASRTSSLASLEPSPGNGDIALELRQTVQSWYSVYQLSDVGLSVNLPERTVAEGTGWLYAPTLLPPGHACIEVTTIHLREPGSSARTKHRQGWYDWCQPGAAEHPFNIYIDLTDPQFQDHYVRSYLGIYSIAIAIEAVDSCSYANIYDYQQGGWSQAYMACPNPISQSPGGDGGLYGWSAWESWDVVGPSSCPMIPIVRAMNLMFASPNTFTYVPVSDYPADAFVGGGVVDCWTNFGHTPYTFVFPGTAVGLSANSWQAQTIPATPFQVSITGPLIVGPHDSECGLWTASVQGGVPSYLYQWSGLFSSMASYAMGAVPQSGGDLTLLVTDALGWQGSETIHITYDPNHQDYCQ